MILGPQFDQKFTDILEKIRPPAKILSDFEKNKTSFKHLAELDLKGGVLKLYPWYGFMIGW